MSFDSFFLDDDTELKSDKRKKTKKVTYREVDPESLKTDSLNQFIEARKVKDLSNWL